MLTLTYFPQSKFERGMYVWGPLLWAAAVSFVGLFVSNKPTFFLTSLLLSFFLAAILFLWFLLRRVNRTFTLRLGKSSISLVRGRFFGNQKIVSLENIQIKSITTSKTALPILKFITYYSLLAELSSGEFKYLMPIIFVEKDLQMLKAKCEKFLGLGA